MLHYTYFFFLICVFLKSPIKIDSRRQDITYIHVTKKSCLDLDTIL